jgi:hypothetical protein
MEASGWRKLLSRRGFIKTGTAATTIFGFDLRPAIAQVPN